jgi:DNA polymerase/3'-5' exonuclease PolX
MNFHKINKETFKMNAYKKTHSALQQKKSILTIDDIKEIGGAKIQEKMKYIIENNKNLNEVEDILQNDNVKSINILMEIHGIGPIKANELVTKYNIHTIKDLKDNNNLLNDIQNKGLKYHSDILKKIKRTEMVEHEIFLKQHIHSDFTITGSYRRELDESGDIDILITGEENNLKIHIDKLIHEKYILKDGIFAYGEHKFMGMCKLKGCKLARRLDILFTPKHEYPFALLYFTGNYNFNINMRLHALSLGYSLNEQGLLDNKLKNKIQSTFESEMDIFEFLNYDYVSPKNRK